MKASLEATDISVNAFDSLFSLACKLSAYFCCSLQALPAELAAVVAAFCDMEKLFIKALNLES
ncbi:hypothetical protein B4145_2263 [Bacillus subtilis]|uniref:Uncharacterized protein n=1 Tax=Bacillus subtilis subsp. subtilis TaxID=135461 RepID=A0ABD3ZVY4_BACIU|nr:hypothetical protein B4067_2263 [Bacillus subtilis subsp. subtilis]KIN54925.1 hypothetical protein B4145_2263 [Bacillus subtilis]